MKTATLLPVILLATGLATQAIAAGGESQPKPTETTTKCKDGEVYDEKTKTCVKSEASLLNDDDRYQAVRELAYHWRYNSALEIIASADNPQDPRFLNYQGYIARQRGDMDRAMAFYGRALAADPDYNLARSYMAQGLIALGDIDGAKAELDEIAARGGRESWAYAALEKALSGEPTRF